MNIYIAGSISGKTPEDVIDYFDGLKTYFENLGYVVFSPMTAKEQLRTEKVYRSADCRYPAATNRAIVSRDRWMVGQADIIYADLSRSAHVSIGTMFEFAWGAELGKHIIAVIPIDNIHYHAFVLQSANIVFETAQAAKDYLSVLSKSIRKPEAPIE